MFRLLTLVSAILAVAHTQTLLYPTSISQISLPLQQQLPLLSPQIQLLPISSIYRLPQYQYKLLLPGYQYQLQTQKTLLPLTTYGSLIQKPYLITGRGGRSLGSSTPIVGGQQQQAVAIAGSSVEQGIQGGYQGVQGIQGIQGYQSGVAGSVAASSVSSLPVATVVPVSSLPVSGLSGLPVSSGLPLSSVPVSSGLPISSLPLAQGLTVGSTASGLVGVQSAHHLQGGQVAIVAQGGLVDTTKLSTGEQLPLSHQQSHLLGQSGLVSGVQALPISTVGTPLNTHHTESIASRPVVYAVALDRPLTTGAISQQGAILPSGGHHQESVGHHQVSHVTIPGQVGIGGGYTSSAFYEAAPSGVQVIPSVPLSSEPIIASDVKINPKAVEQTTSTGHHAGQLSGFEG